MIVLQDLVNQLQSRCIPFDIQGRPTGTTADIANIRHEIEELISQKNEEDYAVRQSAEWQTISAYMQLIIERKRSRTLANGEEIEIPQTEAPAYFEWVLWRAFLAINSLVNKPYKARRFKIDQDFLPVGTAPGGGPDLIFEFDNFVIVVEVTLTANSRQEAVEGEPVRRHVAQFVADYENSGKPVYGLFIANRIDSNTAETFRIGVWYNSDDNRMRLDIIPFTLTQFKTFFDALFSLRRIEPCLIRKLLDVCSEYRQDHQAPAWKIKIEQAIKQHISDLRP